MIRPAAARLLRRLPAGPAAAPATAPASVMAAVTASALVAALSLPTGPVHATDKGPAAEPAAEASPLAVTIESLTPGTVPTRGRLTVTGEVRNRSDSTWTDLKVYLFASDEPMTTKAELAEATATDEAVDVGDRLTGEGLYDEVDRLPPGESAAYRLSIPRSELPFTAQGVYWLGVHVLGTSDEGRVEGADGRARTFIPSVRSTDPLTTLSLVVPLRSRVRRAQDGRLVETAAWSRRLGDRGRFTRLVELGAAAEGVRFTWLVDPAVLDAVRSVADGNPPFSLAPTDEAAQPTESPSPDSSGSPGDDPSESPTEAGTGTPEPAEGEAEVTAEAESAGRWLGDFIETATDQSVLSVPYGDVDVVTLLRGDFNDTLTQAGDLGADTMTQFGLETRRVVAPVDGLLPPPALEHVDPDATLLLSERAADAEVPAVRLPGGVAALLASDAARVGGPSPTPPYDALAVRQRVLAEAAVHGLASGRDGTLIVPTPDLWDPGPNWGSSSFFSAFDVPWIRTVDLPLAAAISDPAPYDGRLFYDHRHDRREVPVANVLATEELSAAGSMLADLLTRNDTIDAQLSRAAMLGSSIHVRPRPHQAVVRTRQISEDVHDRLSDVYIEGSRLVTMSSESGSFQVTVVNGLDEPVTVGIKAETGTDRLQVRTPDRVSLGPQQRASVRLSLSATGTGVHSVRITATTRDGRELGSSTRVKVRSSQVGLVIWLIMGTGAVVFIVAITARILRQLRDRKRTHGPRLKDTHP